MTTRNHCRACVWNPAGGLFKKCWIHQQCDCGSTRLAVPRRYVLACQDCGLILATTAFSDRLVMSTETEIVPSFGNPKGLTDEALEYFRQINARLKFMVRQTPEQIRARYRRQAETTGNEIVEEIRLKEEQREEGEQQEWGM